MAAARCKSCDAARVRSLSEQAQRREQLANAKPGPQIETAAKAARIPERSLLVAANELGCARSSDNGGCHAEGLNFGDGSGHGGTLDLSCTDTA